MPPVNVDLDEKMVKLKDEREAARLHQERKHRDWNDNYELYRNKVRTNRLTQRQAVNVPLMKETVKTILSKIDDPPSVDWKEKSHDEQKELVYQEIWEEAFRDQKLEWLDVLDKKNVLLYGLSTKFLNPVEGKVEISILDTFDVVFDPIMNPMDIESARFIIRQNIFRSIEEVLEDDRYTTKGKEKLRLFADSPAGIIQSDSNRKVYERKLERLRAMERIRPTDSVVSRGTANANFPHLAGGDLLVNITEHYTQVWNEEKGAFERHVITYADEHIELADELLVDLIGIEEYPFVVWAEDPETNDIYPDGIADLVRTPNKIVNVWYSQMIENRTLANFRMHWYDATDGNYTPQTYEPGQGKMLPAPGNPKETIMPVDISGLDESLTAIDFVTKMVERGSGAVAIDKGVREGSQQTLGEVEILVGKAMERSVAMQKFYRGSWYELAKKWDALMHANSGEKVTLFRTGSSGKLYENTVFPSDWKSEAGYEPIVSSTSEQEANTVKTIQKFQFVLQQFPNNIALQKIARRRQLELLDFTPDELKQVEDAENEILAQAQTQPEQNNVNEEETQLTSQIEEQLARLNV